VKDLALFYYNKSITAKINQKLLRIFSYYIMNRNIHSDLAKSCARHEKNESITATNTKNKVE